MKIELSKTHPQAKYSTLVVFSSTAKSGKTEVVKIHDSQLSKNLKESIEQKVITGKAQETILFRNLNYADHQNVLVVGLGAKTDHESVRQVGAALQACLKANQLHTSCVHIDALPATKKSFSLVFRALCEGILLANYSFDELKSKKDKKPEDKKEFHVVMMGRNVGDALVKNSLHEAMTVSECVNFSRRLGDMPGNLMTPTILADTVADACKGTKIKVEIWDKSRIKKEKMGGLLGVAQGSREEPRFIILHYNGGAKSKKPIAYVGKGLTFDTGGISIKPSGSMEDMKYDMCGGANVLGAVLAMAKLKLKVNVMAIVPATENMPGGAATKPGDVHTARNGKTFEVNNTDAEGRLILSDALCYASEQKPQFIVDAATLTGAMVVALGNTHTGFFTRNETLTKKINTAADNSGEWVWRMPLTDFHVKDMKGTFADLSNISSGKGAGSATAAAFLEQFVEDGIPWAHFDIAGTGWAIGGRLPYCPKKGASGVMIRTFVELAKLYQ